MTVRRVILAAAAAIVAIAGGLALRAQPARPPNIIVILADDMPGVISAWASFRSFAAAPIAMNSEP